MVRVIKTATRTATWTGTVKPPKPEVMAKAEALRKANEDTEPDMELAKKMAKTNDPYAENIQASV